VPLRAVLLAGCAVALALAGCGSDSSAPTAARPAFKPLPPPVRVPGAKTLVAAGDIACGPGTAHSAVGCHQRETAAIVDSLRPDAVAVLGDLQYPDATLGDFRRFFGPSWGRWRARMHPSPGNHEYNTGGASGYYDYFGARAGPGRRGWYSWNLGAWHLISLNGNCDKVGCGPGSAQERWLRADLAAHPARCTLAYWHQPRFSSGFHGNSTAVAPLWRALQAAGADVVLSGHDHDYERFAPQTDAARRDDRRGIVQFVVGSGGVNHYPVFRHAPNTVTHSNFTFGVLALTLRPASYSWRFVPERGATYTDAGSARCH
jgi:acid phosphatase type 7